MKAIDTNILVQFLIKDDPAQAVRARRLLDASVRAGEKVFVPLTVLMETMWVLKSTYGCSNSTIYEIVEKITLAPFFQLESAERIKAMVAIGTQEGLEPADALIAISAREAGCETTYTFDRRASKSHFFELLR